MEANSRIRYVYLFELDSVRNTEQEIREGIAALTRALAHPNTCVVLTYNQIADGMTMLRCFSDRTSLIVSDGETSSGIVEMFRRGRIKINRFGDYKGMIGYLVTKLKQILQDFDKSDRTGWFVFSSLGLLYKPWYADRSPAADARLKKIYERLVEGLESNDSSAFGSLTRDDLGLVPSLFQDEDDRITVAVYLKTILAISVCENIYIGQRKGSTKMEEILNTSLRWLEKHGSRINQDCDLVGQQILQAMKNANPNNRSSLYNWLGSNSGSSELERRCKRVIDVAYNLTTRDSIYAPGLRYNESELKELLENLVNKGFYNS